MNKEEYAERLDSPAWRDFADKCKQLAGNRCVMCGITARLNCHHMRYRRLGTPQEWLDIAVVCERCHTAFHEATPFMSRLPASRMELLNELAIAIAKKGRDTTYYDQSSSAVIASIVIPIRHLAACSTPRARVCWVGAALPWTGSLNPSFHRDTLVGIARC